ncbi:MAG: transcription antitermination factor NusB [Candidatus Paceibacterota bacterium]
MANRHLSRSIVLQTLFELDTSEGRSNADNKAGILKRNIEEFAPGTGDFSFMEQLLDGVLAKQKDIDLIIEKAAPDWPLDKIATVDRNILRIGLYELLFADRKEVPAKVAINEAIELAKNFGGENSGKFVNGVLGAVYKELGEPGKDEVSKKKKDVPYEEMPIERLGGAVVYAKHESDIYLALVHDVFGHWTLSKSKIAEGETAEEGTKRAIKEELGLAVAVGEKLGENEYIAKDPEIGKKRKQVTYFLAEADFRDLELGTSGGLDDAKWFKLSDILELNFYHDILPLITKAINMLLAKDTEARKNKND